MPQSSSDDAPSLERIKKECAAMMKLIVKLEQEELDLRSQNEVLARAALLSGFTPGVLEPPGPKRRRRKQNGTTTNISTASAAQSATTKQEGKEG